MIATLIGILLIVLGWSWALRIFRRGADDNGSAIAAVALIVLGIVVLVVRLLVFLATLHWGW